MGDLQDLIRISVKNEKQQANVVTEGRCCLRARHELSSERRITIDSTKTRADSQACLGQLYSALEWSIELSLFTCYQIVCSLKTERILKLFSI